MNRRKFLETSIKAAMGVAATTMIAVPAMAQQKGWASNLLVSEIGSTEGARIVETDPLGQRGYINVQYRTRGLVRNDAWMEAIEKGVSL